MWILRPLPCRGERECILDYTVTVFVTPMLCDGMLRIVPNR